MKFYRSVKLDSDNEFDEAEEGEETLNPDEFEGNYAESYEDEEFETVDNGQDEE